MKEKKLNYQRKNKGVLQQNTLNLNQLDLLNIKEKASKLFSKANSNKNENALLKTKTVFNNNLDTNDLKVSNNIASNHVNSVFSAFTKKDTKSESKNESLTKLIEYNNISNKSNEKLSNLENELIILKKVSYFKIH